MRCLRSIPHRQDIQIIVVDDGSKNADKYRTIYTELSAPEVEFYQLDRYGSAGRARNEGLKHAKGKRVLFADSDDYFNENFHDFLDDYVNCDSDYDIVYFKATSVDSDNKEIISYRANHLNTFIELSETDEEKAIFNLRYLFGEPWCKLIKLDVIKKYEITFDETIIHNDTKFSYSVGSYAKTIGIDKRAVYCVTARPQSVSTLVSKDRYLTRVSVFFEKYGFLKNRGVCVGGKFYFSCSFALCKGE